MIELTEEQRQQLDSGKAVDVIDNQTAQRYVVVRQDVYERTQNWVFDDSDWTHEELLAHLARSADANGWNEPGMEAYDNYDEELAKRCQ